MLRRFLPYLLLVLFVILQFSFIPHLGGILRQLDLLLGLTVAYALFLGPRDGALLGLGAGLLRGLVGGPTLGFYAIPLYIVGYCVGQFSRIVYRKSVLVPFVIGIVTTSAYWLLMTLLTGGLYGFWIGVQFWLALPISVVLNSLLTAVIYGFLHNSEQREDAGGRG